MVLTYQPLKIQKFLNDGWQGSNIGCFYATSENIPLHKYNGLITKYRHHYYCQLMHVLPPTRKANLPVTKH